MASTNFTGLKPFLKWAGGKTSMLPALRQYLPIGLCNIGKYDCYVEPFVGGGGTAFYVIGDSVDNKKIVINDSNKDLINCYTCVRDNTNEIISILKDFEKDYISVKKENQREKYRYYRSLFNSDGVNPVESAALLILLNKTCFNGLYAVNKNGKFNAAWGVYKNTQLFDYDVIRADGEKLKSVEIMFGDYKMTERFSGERTFYYLDPPYRPLYKTSSFVLYTKDRFEDNEQIELSKFVNRISENGSKFALSNSDGNFADVKNDFIDSLYSKYKIHRVSSKRCIGAAQSNKRNVGEIIVTNI